MEILFLLLIFALIIYLNIGGFLPFPKVNEEEIGRNVKHLKKHQWFQSYLSNDEYRKLIVHNKDVRQVIGGFKTNKLNKHSYQMRCQKKLHKTLLKALILN